MAHRPGIHASFLVEHKFDLHRSKVFAGWARPDIKERWFVGPPDWKLHERSFDFSIGGHELNIAGPANGPLHAFEAFYHDIITDERIVYSYTMRLGGKLQSVSIATVEFGTGARETLLRYTEDSIFFVAQDGPEMRRQGTEALLAMLDDELDRTTHTL